MKKEMPVLFSTPMVQAILEGRKTMTRRVVKPQPAISDDTVYKRHNQDIWDSAEWGEEWKCPYGKPGDLLWVRETWVRACISEDGQGPAQGQGWRYWYAADGDWSDHEWHHPHKEGPQSSPRWKPSIHMPKAAARIWLEVTDVRVERLHDITEQDAKAEGVSLHKSGTHYLNYTDQKASITQFIYNCHTAKQSFKTLWILINGFRDEPTAWFKNPWVWVVSFKVLSTTGRPSETLILGVEDQTTI